jgi:hypothetical protein
MGDPHPMEGRQYYLGLHERHQNLISGAACQVCDAETNRRRACIRVVDSTCSAETKLNHPGVGLPVGKPICDMGVWPLPAILV